VRVISDRKLAFRDDENLGSPRNFFQKNLQNIFQTKLKKYAMFLVTSFATVSQIANNFQITCCIIKFCYT